MLLLEYIKNIIYFKKDYEHSLRIKNNQKEIINYIQNTFKNHNFSVFNIVQEEDNISFTTECNKIEKILNEISDQITIENITKHQLKDSNIIHYMVQLKLRDNYINTKSARSLFKYYKSVPQIDGNNITITTNNQNIINKNEIKLCEGRLSDSKTPNGEYIPSEFGLVKVDRVIFSNENSDYIDHVETILGTIVVTLKPKYLKLLIDYTQQNPDTTIVFVINDKVYAPPVRFISSEKQLTSRFAAALTDNKIIQKSIFQSINMGFIDTEIINSQHKSQNHKIIKILILIIILIIALIFMIKKRREKTIQILLNMAFIYQMFTGTELIASSIITILLYFIYLFLNDVKQLILATVFTTFIPIYWLTQSMLIQIWTLNLFYNSIIFIAFYIICNTLIPKQNQKTML